MGKIKEIYCIHHSHLDIGYTHPQALLLELQRDYIDDAIDLCLKTSDYPEEAKFRWTCEATLPVIKWMKTASSERKKIFKELVKKEQISISALMMHTTPLHNTQQMYELMSDKKELEQLLDYKITTAINHDVNGQPWTFSQVLLDAGIEFYLTGINIHFGGIPFKRPCAFYWETPDKQKLLTWLGEHYSLFSQFFYTYENNVKKMHQGITEYVQRLEEDGYNQDFLVLTATNPPLFDNNCPDFLLSDLINAYNQEGYEYKVRFVTPEMLYRKIRTSWQGEISTHKGDWTDYWNFGAGSTARETALSKQTRLVLNKSQFMETVNGSLGRHYEEVKEEAHLYNNLFNEHTWGASESITDPDCMDTYSQRIQKLQMIYKAASLSAYLLGSQYELFAKNSRQAEEAKGILLINTSSINQKFELVLPDNSFIKGRRLKALRLKEFLPYYEQKGSSYGVVDLAPFSVKVLPISALKKADPGNLINVTEGWIETPYYIFEYDMQSGRIKRLYDKQQQWECLDGSDGYSLFEFVRETIDGTQDIDERSTFFPRNVDLGNRSISVWNHKWQAKRQGVSKLVQLDVEIKGEECVYHVVYEAPGLRLLEQNITFYSYKKEISLEAVLDKEQIRTPESMYFAFPLNLKQGWKSVYDTGDMFVELDKEQLGDSSRDWVTIDRTVSLYDEEHGCCLATIDAPLVQIGGFNFGKESKSIPRKEHPLLLSWVTNNYWDTNFSIDQEGKVRFKYLLYPFKQFSAKCAYRLGVEASEPVIMNECTNLNQEDHKLFELRAEHIVPIFIKPSINQKGLILALRNIGRGEESAEFELLDKDIRNASIVTGLEEYIAPLKMQQNSISIQLCSNELKCIYIEYGSK